MCRSESYRPDAGGVVNDGFADGVCGEWGLLQIEEGGVCLADNPR